MKRNYGISEVIWTKVHGTVWELERLGENYMIKFIDKYSEYKIVFPMEKGSQVG